MAPLNSFFDFTLNSDQTELVARLEKFFNSSSENIFIIKGHAGTGKTTLVSGIAKFFEAIERQIILLATTGRASKVLNRKTGFDTYTVHNYIYSLTEDDRYGESGTHKLVFNIKKNKDSDKAVYVIDEVSMLSNHKAKSADSAFLQFGSGKLLSDLVRYTDGRKMIFVGDPSQLPPINTMFSAALSKEYLESTFGLKVTGYQLSIVERQKNAAGISFNTTKLRKNIAEGNYPLLSVKESGFTDIARYAQESLLVKVYADMFSFKNPYRNIILAYSNKKVAALNKMVRNRLFNGQTMLAEGELLMVYLNNYKYELTNGEHIVAQRLTGNTDYRAGLHFTEIIISYFDRGEYQSAKAFIINEFLLAEKGISQEQERNLFIDFSIRMREKNIKPKDSLFRDMMMVDPYLNALRVKYGYAVTCHKAQGGEWENVFMQFERFTFRFPVEQQYRWAYTAISRAVEKLHVLHNYCLY